MQRDLTSVRKWRPAALVVLGVTAILLAAGVSRTSPRHAAAPAADRASSSEAPATWPSSRRVYVPGQTSGWYTHAGLHAVAVLAGELTIYDGECRPHRVVAGEPYVGGRDLHLARNETSERVDMVVTYLNVVGPASPQAGGPAGCPVR